MESSNKENISLSAFTERANTLLTETKLLQICKSANILIDLFGLDKSYQKVKPKHLGKQIEMQFPALNGSLTFTIVSKRDDFKCAFGPPKQSAATIVINVKEENVLALISSIIRLKRNLFGLMRIAPKMLTRKLKIKGSLFTAITLCQTMMIGQHITYKGQL